MTCMTDQRQRKEQGRREPSEVSDGLSEGSHQLTGHQDMLGRNELRSFSFFFFFFFFFNLADDLESPPNCLPTSRPPARYKTGRRKVEQSDQRRHYALSKGRSGRQP